MFLPAHSDLCYNVRRKDGQEMQTTRDMNYADQKIVQSLGYIANAVPGEGCSKLILLKLMFLADRYHLRKFGRTITGDTYRAMPYGPVAQRVRRIIEHLSDVRGACNFLENRPLNGYEVLYATRKPDLSYLSESEREALDAAVRQLPLHDSIVAFTHTFPEWKRHEAGVNAGKRPVMDLSDCFRSCGKSEYCDIPKELLELNREFFEEGMESDLPRCTAS